MSRMQKKHSAVHRVPAIFAIVVAAMITVSGCTSDPIDEKAGNEQQTKVEKLQDDLAAIGESGELGDFGDDVDVNLPGKDGSAATLPEGWPEDVQLVDGTIVLSLSSPDGMFATVIPDDPEDRAVGLKKLTDAGFTVENEQAVEQGGETENLTVYVLKKDDRVVTYSFGFDGENLAAVYHIPPESTP